MPSLNLALCLGMIGCPPDMPHPLTFEPKCQLLRDVARPVITQQAWLVFKPCTLTPRYEHKLDAENAEVANWLIKLTDNHRNWGFGLCYLYLRNVKGFKWNHKRFYRIYKELELNLRIKPRKRLVREGKPPLLQRLQK